MDSKFKFEFTGDVDEIIEEHGNTLVKLATVSWNERPAKLELRKWIIDTATGDLKANKGITFSNKETVDNLVSALIKHGYGESSDIKDLMEERGTNINAVFKKDKEDSNSTEGSEYYDLTDELLED